MKKAVAAGLIILFAGLILTSGVGGFQEEITRDEEVNRLTNSWVISGNFSKGENLTFDLRQHPDWSLPFYADDSPTGLYQKYFMANVTDTMTSNYTLFKIVLMVPQASSPPQAPYNFNLFVASIEVLHHGALITEDKPRHAAGGIVKNTGEYHVDCWLDPEYVNDRDLQGNPWPHPASPPELYLFRTTAETTYPYAFLLPLGISTIAVGFVTSVWGARTKRKVKRKSIGSGSSKTRRFRGEKPSK